MSCIEYQIFNIAEFKISQVIVTNYYSNNSVEEFPPYLTNKNYKLKYLATDDSY